MVDFVEFGDCAFEVGVLVDERGFLRVELVGEDELEGFERKWGVDDVQMRIGIILLLVVGEEVELMRDLFPVGFELRLL